MVLGWPLPLLSLVVQVCSCSPLFCSCRVLSETRPASRLARLIDAMLILTPLEMHKRGLKFCKYEDNGYIDYTKDHVQEAFSSTFGSDAVTLADLWSDLQTTTIPEARIKNATEKDLRYFLLTHRWFKEYSTFTAMAVEHQELGVRDTLSKRTWDMVLRIVALKPLVISWPDEFDRQNTVVYCYTVDGVHFRKYEETHETMSKDPSWYSHKGNGPGVAYEVAVHLWKSEVVHISEGHRKASTHDKTIYLEPGGLGEKTQPGKKGIGDRGYRTKKGEPRLPVCTPNSHNKEAVRKFQARARARQESFFGRAKNFGCLKRDFRGDVEKHSTLFEAICVVLSYQFKNGHPLFDV